MRSVKLLIFLLWTISVIISNKTFAQADKKGELTIESHTKEMQAYKGYFDFYWDEKQGKIWLEIDKFDQEFLYVNSLPAGVGSNDLGLDRGQLGQDRVVKFVRSGPKVLLVQTNYDYRAVSDNEDERRSVEQAFAQSAIGGFKVEAESEEKVLIDITTFFAQRCSLCNSQTQAETTG